MWIPRNAALLALASLSIYAQVATPPGQPITGPGGSTYPYPTVVSFGPFYVNPASPEPYSSFYIFEPGGGSAPSSLPVVLFLHGYLIAAEGAYGDSPGNYIYWIDHLARNGYTVVFPTYDATLQPTQYTQSIINSWQAALTLLESGSVSGLMPPASDSLGLQTVFTGHSMGAVESFAVAQQLTIDPVAGVPIPRAIAGFQPGLGSTGELPTNFSQISPEVRVILVDGNDNVSDIPTAESIWNSVISAIPTSNGDFLEVISDTHGSPAQLGNHWYPDTNGLNDDDSGVDDRDYNITWKLSVGLFNCVLAGTDCSYGLGHGSTAQINMGSWSDGVPVNTLSLQGGGSPSITSVTSTVNPATFGLPVTLTATVSGAAQSSAPTGAVVFTNGSNPLGTVTLAGGSGSLTLQALAAGSNTITASYGGDINFQPSSGTLLEVINQPTSATLLLSSSNPATYDQAITLTAQVNPPSATGTVTFADGANVLSTVTLTGASASFTTSALPAGLNSITATYNGNSILPSSSTTLQQTVSQAVTSLSLTSGANPAPLNQQVTFVATLAVQGVTQGATMATGTVTFSQNGTAVGSPVPIMSGQASTGITFSGSGSFAISAVYSGDANYEASNAAILQTAGSSTQLPLTTLYSFSGPDGSGPSGALILGSDSNFYGTTEAGGTNSKGTVFKISPVGSLTTIYSFAGMDGSNPFTALTSGGDGSFYGTTATGGVNNLGTVFQITSAGALTTLHSFSGTDGSSPEGALALGTDGNFYGTTASGGSNGPYGSVFKMSPGGAFSQIYSFHGTDGSSPNAALTLGTDGNFYGSTVSGGENNQGTIFRISTAGALTTLYSFAGPDGSAPYAPLTLNTDGNFYGTTSDGGANAQYGTVFKITTAGTLTTIHNFAGSDGSGSRAALFPGTDGNFYSTTTGGGANVQYGTIYSITPSGTLTVLHSFAGPDGSYPPGALTLGPDGNLYAVTNSGAAEGLGSVFRLSIVPAFSSSSVTSSAAPSTYGSPLTITGTVQTLSGSGTPTGYVAFSDGASPLGTAAISAGIASVTVASLTPGEHSISAAYGGDSNFRPSTGNLLQQVSQLTPVTAVASSLNPSVYSQSVTLSATVTTPEGAATPTGTITFMDGTASLAVVTLVGGSAAFTSTAFGGGPHFISVAYSGDSNYLPGNATVSQLVNPAPATARVVSSVNPSAFDQGVTLTATVSPVSSTGMPTGTMTFTDGTTNLGAIPLSGGVASFTTSILASGTHSITVAYSGDSNFQPASGNLSQLVNASTTTTVISSSQDPSNYNQSVTFTATISAQAGAGMPTGAVTFSRGLATLGTVTLTGGAASVTTATSPVGTPTISAQYAGTSSFQLSSANFSQQVNPASTSTTLASSQNPAVIGSQVTFTATVTGQSGGNPTGTVTFFENGTAIGAPVTVSAHKASIDLIFSSAATYAITANYSGDSNFTGAAAPALNQQVNLYPTKTTLKSSGSPSLAGRPVTFTATVSASSQSVPDGELVTFYDGSASLGSGSTLNGVATLTTTSLPVGSGFVSATYAGDSTLQTSTSAVLTQTVDRNATVTVLTSSPNPSTYAQLVTFSVAVTSAGPTPTGAVIFKDGMTALGTATLSAGAAIFSTRSLPGGPDSITASYGGDSFSGQSISAPLAQTVNSAPTATTLISSLNPSTPGTAVTFTAEVTAGSLTPAGTVTFAYGSTPLGTVDLTGGKASITTSTLPAGTDTITASFAATTDFLGSSAIVSQTVN